MIGNVYKAPQEVFESGWFIVVGKDSDPTYNATRRPWYLQVRELRDGKPHGPWVPVTTTEFKEWNPNATTTDKQWLARGNNSGVAEPC